MGGRAYSSRTATHSGQSFVYFHVKCLELTSPAGCYPQADDFAV